MTTVPYSIALGVGLGLLVSALVVVGFALVSRVLRWHRARQAHPYECEVCGDKLTKKDARHLVAVYDNNDIGEQGGWAMTATFCRKHYPK